MTQTTKQKQQPQTTSRPSNTTRTQPRKTDEDVANELDNEDEGWSDEEIAEAKYESRKTQRQNGRTKSFRKEQPEFNIHKENDYNDCRFTGVFGKDPELTITENGTSISKFSLSVWQGNGKDRMWVYCVAWNELAEHVEKKFGKKSRATVAGRFVQRKYNNRYYNELYIDFIEKVEV